ncbi:hypothetical protein H2200_008268 [Cladophialophora chaetospira]|uniref:Major facilitator superfamily (MFS) profile domain-containing protein n=1 Tax=Cladophialophora chaetospira TaxID=386627 RepID=A0AA39CGF1_9EURO|nr:hypothetical protein H2200_008268 [Cladophialophora chaetospira]
MAEEKAVVVSLPDANTPVEQDTATPLPPASASPAAPTAGIPNGGLQAWLQVFGAHFLWWNTWGIAYAYGAWQSYYTVGLLHERSPSDIAWIGSVQSFLLLFIGVLTGPVYDEGYFHTLLIVGSGLIVFGMFMTSIATQYWQIMLAQGLCTGLGMGCLFTPAVAHLSTYFSTKMPTAAGLAALGSGIGGVLVPVVFHRLQPRIGFPWATRVIAFLCLGTLAVPVLVMRVRVLPPQRRKIFTLSPWKDPAYSLWFLGAFITFLGTWTPFFYVSLYAFELGAASEATAFYLVAIITAGNAFGRVVPNLMAQRFGMYNILILCTIITAGVTFAFIGTKTLASIIVVSFLYGFFSGGLISLLPLLAVQLSPIRAVIGNRMGMAFAGAAMAVLIGPPTTGNLLDNHGFNAAFAFAGVSAIVGALSLTASRVCHGGWKIMMKM